MPKLVVGTGVGGAIQTAAQAHHFRFIGIEVNPLAGALIYPPENYFPPSLAAVGFVDLASATTAWPRPVHTRTRPPMAPISAPTSTPSRRRRRGWGPPRSRLRTRRRPPWPTPPRPPGGRGPGRGETIRVTPGRQRPASLAPPALTHPCATTPR